MLYSLEQMRGEKQSQVARQDTAEFIGRKATAHQEETAPGHMLQDQMQGRKTRKDQKTTE